MILYRYEEVLGLNPRSSSVNVGPSLTVSCRTAPGLLFLPLMISSFANAGCQVFRLSKFLMVSHTFDTGALTSTVSTTCRVFGASANTAHGAARAISVSA